MSFLQLGEGDDKLIVILRYPDALPSVPEIYREFADAEVARAASIAYSHMQRHFDNYYTDPEQLACRVITPLKKNRGEIEILVLSTRHVDEDIIEDWVQTLMVAPLIRLLFPHEDEFFHLMALRAQQVAEELHVEPDCHETRQLEAVHIALPDSAVVHGLFAFEAVPPDPFEPDETTYEHLDIAAEVGEEIRQRIDLAA